MENNIINEGSMKVHNQKTQLQTILERTKETLVNTYNDKAFINLYPYITNADHLEMKFAVGSTFRFMAPDAGIVEAVVDEYPDNEVMHVSIIKSNSDIYELDEEDTVTVLARVDAIDMANNMSLQDKGIFITNTIPRLLSKAMSPTDKKPIPLVPEKFHCWDFITQPYHAILIFSLLGDPDCFSLIKNGLTVPAIEKNPELLEVFNAMHKAMATEVSSVSKEEEKEEPIGINQGPAKTSLYEAKDDAVQAQSTQEPKAQAQTNIPEVTAIKTEEPAPAITQPEVPVNDKKAFAEWHSNVIMPEFTRIASFMSKHIYDLTNPELRKDFSDNKDAAFTWFTKKGDIRYISTIDPSIQSNTGDFAIPLIFTQRAVPISKVNGKVSAAPSTTVMNWINPMDLFTHLFMFVQQSKTTPPQPKDVRIAANRILNALAQSISTFAGGNLLGGEPEAKTTGEKDVVFKPMVHNMTGIDTIDNAKIEGINTSIVRLLTSKDLASMDLGLNKKTSSTVFTTKEAGIKAVNDLIPESKTNLYGINFIPSFLRYINEAEVAKEETTEESTPTIDEYMEITKEQQDKEKGEVSANAISGIAEPPASKALSNSLDVLREAITEKDPILIDNQYKIVFGKLNELAKTGQPLNTYSSISTKLKLMEQGVVSILTNYYTTIVDILQNGDQVDQYKLAALTELFNVVSSDKEKTQFKIVQPSKDQLYNALVPIVGEGPLSTILNVFSTGLKGKLSYINTLKDTAKFIISNIGVAHETKTKGKVEAILKMLNDGGFTTLSNVDIPKYTEILVKTLPEAVINTDMEVFTDDTSVEAESFKRKLANNIVNILIENGQNKEKVKAIEVRLGELGLLSDNFRQLNKKGYEIDDYVFDRIMQYMVEDIPNSMLTTFTEKEIIEILKNHSGDIGGDFARNVITKLEHNDAITAIEDRLSQLGLDTDYYTEQYTSPKGETMSRSVFKPVYGVLAQGIDFDKILDQSFDVADIIKALVNDVNYKYHKKQIDKLILKIKKDFISKHLTDLDLSSYFEDDTILSQLISKIPSSIMSTFTKNDLINALGKFDKNKLVARTIINKLGGSAIEEAVLPFEYPILEASLKSIGNKADEIDDIIARSKPVLDKIEKAIANKKAILFFNKGERDVMKKMFDKFNNAFDNESLLTVTREKILFIYDKVIEGMKKSSTIYSFLYPLFNYLNTKKVYANIPDSIKDKLDELNQQYSNQLINVRKSRKLAMVDPNVARRPSVDAEKELIYKISQKGKPSFNYVGYDNHVYNFIVVANSEDIVKPVAQLQSPQSDVPEKVSPETKYSLLVDALITKNPTTDLIQLTIESNDDTSYNIKISTIEDEEVIPVQSIVCSKEKVVNFLYTNKKYMDESLDADRIIRRIESKTNTITIEGLDKQLAEHDNSIDLFYSMTINLSVYFDRYLDENNIKIESDDVLLDTFKPIDARNLMLTLFDPNIDNMYDSVLLQRRLNTDIHNFWYFRHTKTGWSKTKRKLPTWEETVMTEYKQGSLPIDAKNKAQYKPTKDTTPTEMGYSLTEKPSVNLGKPITKEKDPNEFKDDYAADVAKHASALKRSESEWSSKYGSADNEKRTIERDAQLKDLKANDRLIGFDKTINNSIDIDALTDEERRKLGFINGIGIGKWSDEDIAKANKRYKDVASRVYTEEELAKEEEARKKRAEADQSVEAEKERKMQLLKAKAAEIKARKGNVSESYVVPFNPLVRA